MASKSAFIEYSIACVLPVGQLLVKWAWFACPGLGKHTVSVSRQVRRVNGARRTSVHVSPSGQTQCLGSCHTVARTYTSNLPNRCKRECAPWWRHFQYFKCHCSNWLHIGGQMTASMLTEPLRFYHYSSLYHEDLIGFSIKKGYLNISVVISQHKNFVWNNG